MRAVAFDTFGGPEVLSLREVPRPEPQEGQVLVKVAAATVNPTDLMMRSGGHASVMKDLAPPYIAGMELAGCGANIDQRYYSGHSAACACTGPRSGIRTPRAVGAA